MIFELLTGDYLFDPAAGSRYNKDDDHIAQVIELMGPFPRNIALSGKYSSELFTRKGELRHISKLKYWRKFSKCSDNADAQNKAIALSKVLQEKYLISEEESAKLVAFLDPMLNVHPDKRATAADMLQSEWIANIPVVSWN